MVVKSIFIQYFSKFITFPLSLIIYSLIVKSLSIEDFKNYNLFLAVVLYITGFIDLGISNFFYREVITKKKYYFFNILFNFKITIFLLIIIVYFLYFNFFNKIISFFIFCYAFLFVLKDIFEKILKSLSKFEYIAYINIGTIFFKLIVIICLYYEKILFLNFLLVVLLLVLCVYIFLYKFVLNSKKIRKNFLLKINFKYFVFSMLFIKKNIKYISPWIIIFLCNLLFSRLDIFMLNYFHFYYDVAEYSSSYNLYEKLEFFLLTISMVFYNVFANKKDLKIFTSILNIITLISLFFVIILLISSNFLIDLIIGNKYKNAKELFIIMVLGTYFKFHTTFLANWLYLHKKEWGVSIGIIIMLLLNVVLNYVYIPVYKDIGAVYATFVSDFFNFLFLLIMMYIYRFNFITKVYFFFNIMYISAVWYFLENNVCISLLLIILFLEILFFIKNIKAYNFIKGILWEKI